MRVDFYNNLKNLGYHKPIKLDKLPDDLDMESSMPDIADNNSSDHDEQAAIVELQPSGAYDIEAMEKQIAEIQASVKEWEEKSANIKESYLKDFTSTFIDAPLDSDVMTDMLDKYNKIKTDILEGDYADIEKNYRLKYLDKSYGSAIGLLEQKIRWTYNKYKAQNKSDEDITSFVQDFSKDVGDSLIALKNSENNNYTSSRLNMNTDTLSKLLKSFFKDPSYLKKYYLENKTQK